MAEPDAELQKYFRDLPIKAKRRIATVIAEQADSVAAEIKSKAPVDTGTLRDSVKVRRGRNTLSLVIEAGGSVTTKNVRSGSGVEFDYALAVEYGTQKAPAQPFFYTTWDERRPEVEQAISDVVSEVIGG